jgi:uncharacterized protein (TIGR02391 family)
MNLKTNIKEDLWLTISNSYESENYRNSILDAMQYLSYLLRDKSGVDNDGAKLVSDAMNGNNPKLKINKYQTRSEQDEHSGMSNILTGLYRGIRNPRSHEQITDNKNDADRIIYFIDYLISILDKAKSQFNFDEFVEQRVFDDYFVQSSPEYAQLLIDEIPIKRRLDVLIEIFRNKIDGNKLELMTFRLFELIPSDEQDQIIGIISYELKTSGETSITKTLQLLPKHLWIKVAKIARIRVEYMLNESISEGTFYGHNRSYNENFGTNASGLLKYFTLKNDLSEIMIRKINSESELGYIYRYFFDELPELMNDFPIIRNQFIAELSNFIEHENTSQDWKDWLRIKLHKFPSDWKNDFNSQLSEVKNDDETLYNIYSIDDLQDIQAFYLDDDIPF